MVGLNIRVYQLDDAERMHEAAVESARDMFPWMPWCHEHYSLDEARKWVETQVELTKKKASFEFVALDENNRFLAGCGLNNINRENRFANIGYGVRSSAAGRGIAPAVVRFVADFAFRETTLNRLEIVCAVDNVRSRSVAEKAGAQFEGVLRNRIMLASGPSDAAMQSLIRPKVHP